MMIVARNDDTRLDRPHVRHGPLAIGRFSRALALAIASTLSMFAGCSGASQPPATNVVLISLDTVRRDHLPTYGYPRDTAPTIAVLARHGIVFWNAFAQAAATVPSHGSIFTGLYPHMHGARSNGSLLDPHPATLAEILRNAGFRTAAFVSGYTMQGAFSGLNRGFELYEDEFRGPRRDGRLTVELAARWLAERRKDERFFVLVHLYDAHGPYRPGPRYATLFRSTDPGRPLSYIPRYQRLREPSGAPIANLNPYVDRYDALIRDLDDLIAEMLSHLDLERTIVLLMSDHGETLGERFHILDHGAQLFDEQIRIPLIMKIPRMEPLRIDAPVESVDVLPTLLDLLDVTLPLGLEIRGTSLVPLLKSLAGGRELVFSEARAISGWHADRGYSLDPKRRILSVRSDRWKLIRYPGVDGDFFELYDLKFDSGETKNVAPAQPAVRDALLDELARWQGDEPALDRPAISPAARERLRALGYAE